ncbi:uncharacterized protein LOC126988738 isoform X1 [Eriocheir sinensis]|uniref:uncharacterized protein LOC126988738 isoform X1 n=2 Tax=Eriocheir sinensis TaxID=95602 RepID=UPI0021C62C2D|nr:uncharacterized protein LOC126988738 isoform X1 [Eriocheir sinensis]
MDVHGSRQPNWTFLLTQLLVLLVIADIFRLPSLLMAEGNTCGCWGKNQIYVHYSPPVSGWFNRRNKFVYERFYSVLGTEPTKHRFLLRYTAKRNYWVLLEQKDGRMKRILSNGRFSDTDRIIVSCPTGQCSCQEVLVDAQGSSCFHFDGLYKRTSRDGRNSTTDTQPTERKEKRSQCLLTELSKCLTKNQDTNTEKGCEMYTEPLMANATKPESGQEKYEMFFFEMKKLDEHDFWLIESEEKVYAVSRNIGPCPDQLTPDSNAWIRTDDNFSESINVTCVAWDSPSGD